MNARIRFVIAPFLVLSISTASAAPSTRPTVDDGSSHLLDDAQASAPPHHVRHAELYARGIDGINVLVLRAIDTVQATAMDGGGYFIGVKARPAESPIGYPLKLLGHPMLDPPRKSSYCSGTS